VSIDGPLAAWVEATVALFVLASGIFAVIGGIGLLRLRQFFDRMHPPALASTLGAWCAALASVVYFSALEMQLAFYPLIVNLLLAITTPVTTALLARAGLLRKRVAGAAVPPPLSDAAVQRES
jgi:multicomponent K+:H+ antiporter subunit G